MNEKPMSADELAAVKERLAVVESLNEGFEASQRSDADEWWCVMQAIGERILVSSVEYREDIEAAQKLQGSLVTLLSSDIPRLLITIAERDERIASLVKFESMVLSALRQIIGPDALIQWVRETRAQIVAKEREC